MEEGNRDFLEKWCGLSVASQYMLIYLFGNEAAAVSAHELYAEYYRLWKEHVKNSFFSFSWLKDLLSWLRKRSFRRAMAILEETDLITVGEDPAVLVERFDLAARADEFLSGPWKRWHMPQEARETVSRNLEELQFGSGEEKETKEKAKILVLLVILGSMICIAGYHLFGVPIGLVVFGLCCIAFFLSKKENIELGLGIFFGLMLMGLSYILLRAFDLSSFQVFLVGCVSFGFVFSFAATVLNLPKGIDFRSLILDSL